MDRKQYHETDVRQRKMNCKDRLTHAILSHVEQYKLTTAEIVAHRFFSNEPKASRIKKAKSKLRSICSKNLLESHLFPSKKSRFYAAPGAKLEPAAINYDLAVLIWCNTPTAVRHRISHQDLKKLLPRDNTPHQWPGPGYQAHFDGCEPRRLSLRKRSW